MHVNVRRGRGAGKLCPPTLAPGSERRRLAPVDLSDFRDEAPNPRVNSEQPAAGAGTREGGSCSQTASWAVCAGQTVAAGALCVLTGAEGWPGEKRCLAGSSRFGASTEDNVDPIHDNVVFDS